MLLLIYMVGEFCRKQRQEFACIMLCSRCLLFIEGDLGGRAQVVLAGDLDFALVVFDNAFDD